LLIDLTDDKFKILANGAIIDFIRRTNPSAHSNVGDKLALLGKAIAGAHSYCPSPRSSAYLVLHTEANVIFALAFDMRNIAVRLPPDELAESGVPFHEIGEDWLCVDAFAPASAALLPRWCAAAFSAAARGPRR
jgi:hypothetical protein